MSSSTTSDSLSKAYQLIEVDELAAARAVLEPILASDASNVDAWWLYAHAVTDTFAARKALDEVIRLDPHYPGALELMGQLEVVSRSDAETEPLPVADMTELDLEPDFDEGQFDDEEEEAPVIAPVTDLRDSIGGSPRRSWVPIAALVAIVAVVLLAAILLLQPAAPDGGNDVVAVPSPTVELGIGVIQTEAVTDEPIVVIPPTQEETEPLPVETEAVIIIDEESIVEEPTEAVIEEEPIMTEPVEVVTEEATEIVAVDAASAGSTQVAMLPPGADFTPLVDALAAYSVAPDDVTEMETNLGETVVVTVCTESSASVRQNLPAVMDVIASRAAVLASDAEAIGARLVNCDTDRSLIFIAVPKEQAVEYAVGNLTAEDFQASWRPQ